MPAIYIYYNLKHILQILNSRYWGSFVSSFIGLPGYVK
jgi:hypothetical protein